MGLGLGLGLGFGFGLGSGLALLRRAVLFHEVHRQGRAPEPCVADRAARRRRAAWVRLVVELQVAPQRVAAQAAETTHVAAQRATAGQDGRDRAQCSADRGARGRHHHRARVEAVEPCPDVGRGRLVVHDGKGARQAPLALGQQPVDGPGVDVSRDDGSQCRLFEGFALLQGLTAGGGDHRLKRGLQCRSACLPGSVR